MTAAGRRLEAWRPGLGHQYLAHLPQASFPSDDATLLFGLDLPLLVRPTRGWGRVFLAFASATAWARVYLDVPFPADMLGGLAVALAAWGGLGRAAAGPVLPGTSSVYDWGLRALYLAEAVFSPR